MNNGNRYTNETKLAVRKLRRHGLTHREIHNKVGIALSSAHLWTKDIVLNLVQIKAIQKRKAKSTYTVKRRQELSESAKKNLSKFWRRPHTKEELLTKIENFYLENKRIPLKREFNMYEEYKKRFGSWNNAIIAAGFEPNPVIFSKKYLAKDGHICDSFAEKVIDDWLCNKGVIHEKNLSYPGTKMTADFTIGNIQVEYFGLVGEVKGYEESIKKKREFCLKNNLELVEIYPNELFSKNFKSCLGKIFRKIKTN